MENHHQLPPPPDTTALTPRDRGAQHHAVPTTPYDVPYHGPDPSDNAEIGGLYEYWRIIRRRKGTLILISTIGALIGFLVTLPQTPIYQARTSVEIVGLNDNFLNIKQVNPVTQTGATSETSDIQTQIKILQSESLLDRVTAKLHTGVEPNFIEQNRISAWRRALNLPTAPASNREQSLRQTAKSLKVRAAGQSRILEITADSPDPSIAASFANTLATEYIEQNLESRWKTTEHTSEWLTRQLDDMRIKLEHSEDALQAYARQSGLMFTSEKTNVSEEKLRQLQVELSAAQGERISRQSRYEMATTSPPDALPDVLADPTLRDYQTKLTDLRRQIAELSATYTAEHKSVKRVQSQLATLESAYDRDRSAILKRIKNDYDESLRKEKLLTSAYATQSKLVSGESEKAIQYNILKREVDSNRSLYDTMLQQLKQSTIAAAMRASNIRVVDPARVPTRPYKPDLPVSAGLGLLTGIFLGAAFIIMRERADRSIQQPGDTPFYLNIPELGIIPAGGSDPLPRKLILRLRKPKKPGTAEIRNSATLGKAEEAENTEKPGTGYAVPSASSPNGTAESPAQADSAACPRFFPVNEPSEIRNSATSNPDGAADTEKLGTGYAVPSASSPNGTAESPAQADSAACPRFFPVNDSASNPDGAPTVPATPNPAFPTPHHPQPTPQLDPRVELDPCVELVTWQRKPSILAESFRSALISILFTGENGSRPRVLVLTSSGPAEGKSTVVSNLGIAIAEVGQKVLIIDADMRKPRMHSIFGMTNEHGLSDILRQRTTLNGDPTMSGLIRESEIPNLFILTSGGSCSSATNLLYGNYMPELLKHLRAEFETILIDTPPMLQIPDARVLGRLADKVILVVRAGKTTRDAAIAARQRFMEDRTQLMGTILNDWDPKHSPTGYYGYYNGYYRQYAREYGHTHLRE